VNINVGNDVLGFCDQRSSYKHVYNFERLRTDDGMKLRAKGKDS